MKKNDTLDKIFDKFMTAPTIYKNQNVLQPSYIPDKLPHRIKQIEKIGLKIASVLRGGTPSNIFCYGKTGTGKTAVTQTIIESLTEKCKSSGITPPLGCIINCRTTKSEYSILRELCRAVGLKNVPHTGFSKEKLFSDFVKELIKKNQLMIIVLDEIDQLIKENNERGNDILYRLTKLKTEDVKIQVSLIGISNDLKFKEFLDPRVMSRLGEEEILFPPYTASELKNILQERSQQAFILNTVNLGVLSLCAALSAQEHGDARRAIDLLRVAAEVATRNQSKIVEEKHIREANEEIDRNLIVESIRGLTIHSKMILFASYVFEKYKMKDTVTGDLYNMYSEISDIIRLEKLTQRRISDLISELDMQGLLNARIISKGRYGRTKKIKSNIPQSIAASTLFEEPRIAQLQNYKPSLV
ncbi:MAG: Cdc6/Cdc18 family protein [Candidatus Ranarchaeia archaeon]